MKALTQSSLNRAFQDQIKAQRELTRAALAKADAQHDYDMQAAQLVADGKVEGSNAETRAANLAIQLKEADARVVDKEEEYESAKLTYELAALETSRIKWSIRLSILQSADPTMDKDE